MSKPQAELPQEERTGESNPESFSGSDLRYGGSILPEEFVFEGLRPGTRESYEHYWEGRLGHTGEAAKWKDYLDALVAQDPILAIDTLTILGVATPGDRYGFLDEASEKIDRIHDWLPEKSEHERRAWAEQDEHARHLRHLAIGFASHRRGREAYAAICRMYDYTNRIPVTVHYQLQIDTLSEVVRMIPEQAMNHLVFGAEAEQVLEQKFLRRL